eukprot:3934501-Rhodomonas_salina.4
MTKSFSLVIFWYQRGDVHSTELSKGGCRHAKSSGNRLEITGLGGLGVGIRRGRGVDGMKAARV